MDNITGQPFGPGSDVELAIQALIDRFEYTVLDCRRVECANVFLETHEFRAEHEGKTIVVSEEMAAENFDVSIEGDIGLAIISILRYSLEFGRPTHLYIAAKEDRPRRLRATWYSQQQVRDGVSDMVLALNSTIWEIRKIDFDSLLNAVEHLLVEPSHSEANQQSETGGQIGAKTLYDLTRAAKERGAS